MHASHCMRSPRRGGRSPLRSAAGRPTRVSASNSLSQGSHRGMRRRSRGEWQWGQRSGTAHLQCPVTWRDDGQNVRHADSGTGSGSPRQPVRIADRSVGTRGRLGAVLVEDQVLTLPSPDLDRKRRRAQVALRVNRDRAVEAAGPHPIPLRQRSPEPSLRVHNPSSRRFPYVQTGQHAGRPVTIASRRTGPALGTRGRFFVFLGGELGRSRSAVPPELV
jgi:hypothetical protein